MFFFYNYPATNRGWGVTALATKRITALIFFIVDPPKNAWKTKGQGFIYMYIHLVVRPFKKTFCVGLSLPGTYAANTQE